MKTEENYSPIPLKMSHSYSAYQFYADAEMRGHSLEECFRYTVLTVLKWLDEKKKSKTPADPEKFCEPEQERICSFKEESENYLVNVTYLPQTFEWALRLREPDNGTDSREAVPGRLFITRCAVRLNRERKCVNIGCRIDVIDPENTPELSYAFRPVFFRWLIEGGRIVLYRGLPIGKLMNHVGNKTDLKTVFSLIECDENMMPVAVFTLPGEKKKLSKAEIQQILTANPLIGQPGARSALPAGPLSLFSGSEDRAEDAANYGKAVIGVAEHMFCYMYAALVDQQMFSAFRDRAGININAGDLVIFEPKRFGGEIKIVNRNRVLSEKFIERMKEEWRPYSKHKEYSFENLRFEKELALAESEIKISELADTKAKNADELKTQNDELLKSIQDLQDRLEEEIGKNESLQAEKDGEYERARKQFENEISGKEADNDALCGQIDDLEKKNKRLEDENQRLNARISELKERSEKEGIVLLPCDVKEAFEDEQYDLIVNVLQNAENTYCTENSRAMELLDGILEKNRISGKGLEWEKRVRAVFEGDADFDGRARTELTELGFKVSDSVNAEGHYTISLHGRKKYREQIASTPGDVRTMKNTCSQLLGRISIYKNPKK